MTSTARDEPAALALSPRARRALIIGLVLAVTTYAFDELSVTAAMPAIVKDLGGVSLYGAAFSAFMLANLFSLVIAGPLADRRGPRPVLAAGLACFAAGLVVGGLAPTMPIVVLGRAIQGLGAGAIGASSYVVIGRAFPAAQRAHLFAIVSAAWIIPGLVAPGAAGAIADHLTWRLVFLALLPFPVIAAGLALPPLHDLTPVHDDETDAAAAERRAADRRRVALATRLAVGTALVVAGLEQRGPQVAVPLVVVGAVIALPALARLLPAGTTRAVPGLPAVVATRALVNWCFFGTDAFIPLAVVEVRGRSNLLAGLALTTSSLSWSACAWLQARLARRWSPRLLTAGGNVLIGVGIVVAAAVLDQRVPVAIAFIGWAIAGAGMGFAFNTTSVAALDEAEPGEEGITSSSLQLADALGIALSTGVGGAVVALGHRHGWSTASTLVIVFCITGAAVIPAVLASWRIRDPKTARSRR